MTSSRIDDIGIWSNQIIMILFVLITDDFGQYCAKEINSNEFNDVVEYETSNNLSKL